MNATLEIQIILRMSETEAHWLQAYCLNTQNTQENATDERIRKHCAYQIEKTLKYGGIHE